MLDGLFTAIMAVILIPLLILCIPILWVGAAIVNVGYIDNLDELKVYYEQHSESMEKIVLVMDEYPEFDSVRIHDGQSPTYEGEWVRYGLKISQFSENERTVEPQRIDAFASAIKPYFDELKIMVIYNREEGVEIFATSHLLIVNGYGWIYLYDGSVPDKEDNYIVEMEELEKGWTAVKTY